MKPWTKAIKAIIQNITLWSKPQSKELLYMCLLFSVLQTLFGHISYFLFVTYVVTSFSLRLRSQTYQINTKKSWKSVKPFQRRFFTKIADTWILYIFIISLVTHYTRYLFFVALNCNVDMQCYSISRNVKILLNKVI